jgi:hypothetical protein
VTIRVQIRPMIDRVEGSFTVWLTNPAFPNAPFWVGLLRRDDDGGWTARLRDSGKGSHVPAPWRRLPDRTSAATWIIVRSGYAEAPPGWREPVESPDVEPIPLPAFEAEEV